MFSEQEKSSVETDLCISVNAANAATVFDAISNNQTKIMLSKKRITYNYDSL